jgi:integrase
LVSSADAFADHQRPRARFLIGSGRRSSEAIAVRWHDLDLADRSMRIGR